MKTSGKNHENNTQNLGPKAGLSNSHFHISLSLSSFSVIAQSCFS